MICSFSALSQLQKNPPLRNVADGGLPLAQIFDSQIRDTALYTKYRAKVLFIWGASGPSYDRRIVTSKYFPSWREPDKKRSVVWYKKFHPDWVMYKNDQVTPAYGYIYKYGGLVPLDISNPDVRQYYLDQYLKPAILCGYRAIAMDNVELGNWPGAAGIFRNNKWTKLYTGQKQDPAFAQNTISWMQFLADSLHRLGVKLAANIKVQSGARKDIMCIMHAVDFWLDETGFTHKGENLTDKEWEDHFLLVRDITSEKGYISINQVKGMLDSASSDQITWVIANFLLCKGPQSYLAITGYKDGKAVYQQFHYRKEMDLSIGTPLERAYQNGGVWMRHYSNGTVYVNPSSENTVSVILSKSVRNLGKGSPRLLKLSPASAAIILKLK